MGTVSYSGSYIGSHKTNDGQDMVYTYPPDFIMVFKKYRKQSSWERDAILSKALIEYVNREVHAPAVVRTPTGDERGSTTELRNIDRSNVPTGITGGVLKEEAEKAVSDLLNVSGEGEKPMKAYDKAAGLDKSMVSTVKNLPIVLVAIAIGVLGYFLFGKQRA